MERNIRIDICRIYAFFSVIMVHSLLNCGYYYEKLLGKRMLIMTFFRTSTLTCVPLFLLITGYLLSSRTYNFSIKDYGKHIKKLSKIIVTYLLSMIVIMLFFKYYKNESITFSDFVYNIGTYQYYSWYVELYISLFLIIPFLNVLWNHQSPNQKSYRRLLVLLFIISTSLQGIINCYDFFTPIFWKNPLVAERYYQIIPDWLSHFYPVTYYFIGAYIHDEVDIKKINTSRYLLIIALLVISTIAFGLFDIWRCGKETYVGGEWDSYSSIQNVVLSVLKILIILRIPWEKVFKKNNLIILISNLTFGAYLLSVISDSIVYKYLSDRIPDIQDRFTYLPITIALSAILSLLFSGILYFIINSSKRIICHKKRY